MHILYILYSMLYMFKTSLCKKIISCPRMSTTAYRSWELPVERPKKRIIETKWQLARWPPTRARNEPEGCFVSCFVYHCLSLCHLFLWLSSLHICSISIQFIINMQSGEVSGMWLDVTALIRKWFLCTASNCIFPSWIKVSWSSTGEHPTNSCDGIRAVGRVRAKAS